MYNLYQGHHLRDSDYTFTILLFLYVQMTYVKYLNCVNIVIKKDNQAIALSTISNGLWHCLYYSLMERKKLPAHIRELYSYLLIKKRLYNLFGI